ncbi:Nucleolar GTP-binding protein 1 [Forsythia ovata]|uniref:Nucleolar GTP-binding protein 1 n=1 Tax=Forsythia ovata TaxID=205694 RepID=A0ABD1RZ60_9LAMI
MKSKKLNNYSNRFHVAMPKPRDQKERPPCIHEAVLEAKAKKTEQATEKQIKLEKDLEEENGGACMSMSGHDRWSKVAMIALAGQILYASFTPDIQVWIFHGESFHPKQIVTEETNKVERIRSESDDDDEVIDILHDLGGMSNGVHTPSFAGEMMEDEEGDRLNKKDLLNKRRREQWAASRDYRNKRRRDNRLKKLQNVYTDNFARYRQQIISERSEGISIRTCNHNDDYNILDANISKALNNRETNIGEAGARKMLYLQGLTYSIR